MTTSRFSRLLVALASAAFAVIALAIWASPEQAAHRFGLEALRDTGLASLRADLGGLFFGMAVLCAAAAWTRRRPWILAAASVLAAVVVGRALAWIGDPDVIGRNVAEMALELGVIAALLGLARGAGQAPVHASARPRRLALVAGLFLLVPVAGGAALLNPDVPQRIFDAAAQRLAASVNSAPLEDDALRVAICGSSAPLPSARRAKACVAVFAGGQFFLVDVGPESVENLVLWGVPLASVGGVFLTHFHSDHIGDLGELNLQTWAGGRSAPLAVYGGPGVERVADGFNQAYQLDQSYRTAHHTERVMPSSTWPMVPHTIELGGVETPAKDRTVVAYEEGGLRITAIEVDHAPITPAYAYRFDYKGRSVLITGDLKDHRPLVTAARGVDVLVSEAIALSMTRALGSGATAAGRSQTAAIMHDIEDYHITPEQAARIANDAGAKLLVFYHLLPSPDGPLARRVFAEGVDEARRGDWTIADDGSLYTLPIGSADVRIGSVGD